jgi:hypothetical protein
MMYKELVDLLINAGFDSGWVLTGDVLTYWEHDAEPPKPLTRPSE